MSSVADAKWGDMGVEMPRAIRAKLKAEHLSFALFKDEIYVPTILADISDLAGSLMLLADNEPFLSENGVTLARISWLKKERPELASWLDKQDRRLRKMLK